MSFNPNFFLICEDGKFFAYNLITQKLYEVTEQDAIALKNLSGNSSVGTACNSLKQYTDLGFVFSKTYTLWEGNIPSQIAHKSSRILSQNTKCLSPEQLAEEYTRISNESGSIPERYRPQGDIVELPSPTIELLETTSIAECLTKRKTSRSFNGAPIKQEELSVLLHSCFGNIHPDDDELENNGFINSIMRRSSPSSTGLASCDAYVWVQHVMGLNPGLYFYNNQNHTLVKQELNFTPAELSYAMLDQYWCQDIAVGIFIVNDLRMAWIKDHSCRAYIASHQEAGHLSQNVLLVSTALNLRTWLSGSFRDDVLNKKLKLPDYRFVSLFIGLGHGTGSIVPKGYTHSLQQR